MSEDIATLGIKVDSSDVKNAGNDLDRLTDKGKAAAGATGGVTNAFNSLRAGLAALGLGVVLREFGQLADTYKNIQGRLGLVTSGTQELAVVSDKLFAIAQRTRVEFEAVTDLYASLARSTKALGASQGDLLQVTETINQALIVSGANAASSEAALRQLGQGFASGALRGDELNSVLENTPRLAQAIADGMDVTVGKLRALGAEGKITGEAVFNALKSQRETIEREFLTMPVTIGQAFTGLRNELLKFVGETDSATGASSAFASAIQSVAQNIDTIAFAIEVLVAAIGIKLVASFVAATAAAVTKQAALIGLTTASEIAGFAIGTLVARLAALSILGGVAVLMVALANDTVKTNSAIANANRAFDEMKTKAEATGKAASTTGGQVGGLGKDALGSIPKINAFAGRVGNAAQELYNMARAARAARAEMLQTNLTKGLEEERTLANTSAAGRADIAGQNWQKLRQGDLLGIDLTPVTGGLRNYFSGGRTDREAAAAYAKRVAANRATAAELRKTTDIKNNPIGLDDMPTASGATGGGDSDKKKKKKSGGGGKSDYEQAVDDSKKYIEQLQRENEAIGMNEFELQRQAVAREIAKAPTEALKQQIRDTASALEAETLMFRANKGALDAVTEAIVANDNEVNQQKATAKQMLDQIQFDNSLLKMNAREREVATQMRALETAGIKEGSVAWDLYGAAILRAAEARGQEKLDIQNVRDYTDAVHSMNDAIRDTVDGFGQLFGSAGEGFENLINVITNYSDRRAELEERIREGGARGEQASADLARAEIQHYGDMLGAAKTFFKEKSTGYKILEAAEKAYRLFQLVSMAIEIANTAKSIVLDTTKTASSVANSGVRASADGAAAIAKVMASIPPPFNFIVAGATAAFLIAAGVKMLGGGKGSSTGAATEATKATAPTYSGPVDEYGQPTSSYSVLKPGRTRVANDNGFSGSSPAMAASGGGSFGGGISFGDTTIKIEGSADQNTVDQMRELLEQNRQQTIQDARLAVAQDNAASNSRQRIGGAS